ncbi:sterile alpha motif domain-containing protein 3-like [Amblyomma americanum]
MASYSFQLSCKPSHSDDDGHNFKLPSLGSLHESIHNGSPLSSAAFRKIVDLLFSEMKKSTLFPTRHFYTRVTSLLLENHPQLRDVVGSGADSWKVALRYRFKNQRRVLPSDGRIGENRTKFAARRKCSEAAGAMELERHKVRKLAAATSAIAGEDEASFVMHTQWLMAECRKASPDECQMLERMSVTSRRRIADISASTVNEAKERYPYLMNFERFCSDFQTMTKINPSACISEGINKIMKLALMKLITCEASTLDSLRSAAEMAPERLRTRHIQTVAVLRILSANVKELNGLSALFLQEEDLSVPATPCIVFTGQEIEEADFLYLEVDREKLFRVKNAEEGLAAVLSAYWLFNVQYERKLFNTLVVLERLFLGLALTTPRVVATKFLNKIAKSV